MARWTNDAVGARRARSARTSTAAAPSTAPTSPSTRSRSAASPRRGSTSRSRAKYGLRQTIADTSGVGAVFRALRTIPVLLGIADDMAELCPDAWMLNYTNPMAMNCWAWYAGSLHQNIVGLCHSIQNTSRQVAEYVGVPPERDHLPRRRREPHELGAARGARRREPLPGARRGDRGRPRRARPPRPRADLQALRLLPHRVERALRRVRALVHARRRRDRAPAHPRRRVHPPQRGEPRASTTRRSASWPPASPSRSSAAASTRR